jgi:hypothetical protein
MWVWFQLQVAAQEPENWVWFVHRAQHLQSSTRFGYSRTARVTTPLRNQVIFTCSLERTHFSDINVPL